MRSLPFAAVLLLWPSSLRAEGTVVAVFDVEVKGLSLHRDALDRLSSYLTGRVAAAGTFEVIPRNTLNDRLREQKKSSYRACYDEACQIEIGKELAAEKIIDPQVIKIGAACTVTITLVDLRKSTTERAASVEGTCTEEGIAASLKTAVGELAAPRTVSKPDEGKTRCEIDLGSEGCPGDPSLKTTFDDDFESASTDQARCLRRARDYYDWCGKSEPATSRFFTGARLIHEERAATNTRCQIELGAEGCPATKDLRKRFNDAFQGSEANEARCVGRARDFYDWCGKQTEAVAKFISGGKVLREARAATPSRCGILLGEEGCPSTHDVRLVFNDIWESSDTDGARCLRRAREHFDYCGRTSAVTARFISGGKILREERAIPGTRCEIILGEEGCPATRDLRSFFHDSWEGSDKNEARCLKRAREYFDYCGKANPATARFVSKGALVREERAQPPTRCEIVLGDEGCPATLDGRRVFNDNWDQTAGIDQNRCMGRALEFYLWCGKGEEVVARFFSGANLVREQRAKTPSRCEIVAGEQGCAAISDKRRTWNDDWDGSGSNGARCLRRAREYFGYCGAGAPISARFYQGRDLVQQETWNPTSWCQVTLPVGGCPANGDARARFHDDWEGAGSNRERCFRRAEEYRSHCRISGKVQATFFSGGKDMGSKIAP